MRRAVYSLLLAAWAGLGCESLPRLWDSKPAAPPQKAEAAKPRPAITAEQVTETNAHEAAAALLDEMDREAQGEAPQAAEKAAEAKPAAGKRK